jgi:hypothetical protein
VRLVEFLVRPLPPGTAVNLADALVGPDVLRPFLDNWEDVVRYFIRSDEAAAAADGTAETAALLDRLLAYPGVDAVVKRTPDAPLGGPVLPLRFRKGKAALDLFTTLATPQDITLQELRIECFFHAGRADGRPLPHLGCGPPHMGAKPPMSAPSTLLVAVRRRIPVRDVGNLGRCRI